MTPFPFAPGTWWRVRDKLQNVVVCVGRNPWMRCPSDEWIFFQWESRSGTITTDSLGKFHPDGAESKFDIVARAERPVGVPG